MRRMNRLRLHRNMKSPIFPGIEHRDRWFSPRRRSPSLKVNAMTTTLFSDFMSRISALKSEIRLRRELSAMPDHLVADIGLDRGELDLALATTPIWERLEIASTPIAAARPAVAAIPTAPKLAFANLAAA